MIGDIVKEIGKQLVGEKKGILGLPTGTGGWTGWGPTPRTDFQSLSKEGYEKNALIYACVGELASSASEARLVVEQKKGKEWVPAPEHGLQLLLDDPNPLMSAYEFWFNTIMYLSIAGKCFWEMEPSGAGRIVGLWLMRPDLVQIEAVKVKLGERTRKKIAGFKWLGADGSLTFPTDRVLYFKHPHPRDEIEGLPPMAACARDGDTDNFATDFVQSFFKNAAVPFGIFKMKGFQDAAMIEEAKARLKGMYGAEGMRWHDPLFLGEDSDWVQLGSTFNDMDFPQLRRITETRICAVFQVPPILAGAFVGLEKGSLGTPAYLMARKAFWTETLLPSYKKHAGIINRQLAPHFGRDVRVVWDFSEVEALQEEKDARWKRATEAFRASMITRNMALEEIGKEHIEGGDVFIQPVTSVTITTGEAKSKAIDLVAHTWEGRLSAAIQKHMAVEEEAVLKVLRSEGKASVKGTPYATFRQSAQEEIDVRASEGTFLLWIGGLEESLAEHTDGVVASDGFLRSFVEGLAGESKTRLLKIVEEARQNEWSVKDIRTAIKEAYEALDTGHIAHVTTVAFIKEVVDA